MVTFLAANLTYGEAIAGALDWWREAGLSHDFADDTIDWLERAEPEAPPAVTSAPQERAPPPPPPAPPPARIGGNPALWPQDLAAFQAWWMAEGALDGGHTTGRVPPRGPANAELMVIIEYPEGEDRDTLLSGPQGRLVQQILSALGTDPAQVYFASALPRHMPLPDWAALDRAGLGQLLTHHVTLAAPRRVIGFGRNVSSLLGHAPAKSGEPGSPYYPIGAGIAALSAPGLDQLALGRARLREQFWQALLAWPH